MDRKSLSMSAKSIRERIKAVSHGGNGQAYNEGCHCQKCRAAHVIRMEKLRKQRHEWMVQGLVHPEHGKKSTYINYMCRCEPCSIAHSAACKAYRETRKAAAQRVRELLSL